MINEAEAEIEDAFKAVLSAESVGANVSDPINRLNLVGALLAETYMALRVGEISDAALKLEECIDIARGIKGEALSLREAALAEAEWLFKKNMTLSATGLAIFLTLLLILWRRFRVFYVRRLMNMRPEVSMDAESRRL
ncbi:MAG: hypothetical protein QXR84_08500 [Candidatus Bathyarchaeia archaeon]